MGVRLLSNRSQAHIDKINKNVIDKKHILTLLNDDYTVLDNSPYFLDAYSHILYYYEEYAEAIPYIFRL